LPGSAVASGIFRATVGEQQEWIGAALAAPGAEPVVRVWMHSAPAVVLGCSQRPSAEMTLRAARAGVELCVRRCGGGAVLAGPWMLGATVVLPPRHPLVVASIPLSYRWFGTAHVAWLQETGIDARVVPSASAPADPSLSWACFAGLSHCEVEAGGGKIVGLAQARRRHAILFSSAALIAPPPWEVLCEVFGRPGTQAPALAKCTSSYRQLVGRPAPADTLARSLCARLAACAALPSVAAVA
jgi:lipoate---protein ligase